MRRTKSRFAGFVAVVLAFALVAAACGDDDAGTTEPPATTEGPATTEAPATTAAPTADPVIVCELAYYTGEFAPYGPALTADVAFPIADVINDDPPLGRPWVLISEDLGTVGEGQAARTCLEVHGAEIVVSMSHGYRTYRDWVLEWIAENDGPLGPTVHGGTVPGNLGGNAAEPLFRAQGLDEALGFSGVLKAEDYGAQTVVVFATEVEGFQIAAGSAVLAAEALGIEVLARIDVPAEQPSYRTEAQQLLRLNPDAVIIQAGSVESATLINEFAEAGGSTHWIGETGWNQPEFVGGLNEGVIATQKSIGFAGIGYRDDNPAWDFYEATYLASDIPPEGQEDPAGAYHYTTYDLMIVSALAVEYGGSYKASDWAPAMFAVTSPPGTVCYTYAECLALIRAGEDIDYEGVTGSGEFTEGGVNEQFQSYTGYNEDGSMMAQERLAPERVLALIELATTEAECDENNVCTW
jgi:hypothetical protein